ncbi:MAG: hypothetical protein LBH13_02265 [Cellulomonadaceae bacterium]|jgi:tetratricopeptide (TPR) repeat protein|nr:hypothetical protein [Cellulomonadaceae bacterium]
MRELDKPARERLRGLSKENAEIVGAHLVMAGRLLDRDPELAWKHTQVAVRRAGRVDVVREAAGIAAYRTGRYTEALRELRTARRLNGSSEHLPLMADCERGLGRPSKALELAASPEARTLTREGRVELALVVAGARVDMGDLDTALAIFDRLPQQSGDLALRVIQAHAGVLEAAERFDEAAALLTGIDEDDLERAAGNDLPDEDIEIFDTVDEELERELESPELDPEPEASGRLSQGALRPTVETPAAETPEPNQPDEPKEDPS